MARYPRPKSAILPLAHLAQDQAGWLSAAAMAEIADLAGVSAAEVQGTCSFYTMLKRRPCGRFVVSVCTNVTCLVTGGPEILEHLEAEYGTDPDVTVEEVECLAACGGAPSMQVNYEFHERLTPGSARGDRRGVPRRHACRTHDLGSEPGAGRRPGRCRAFARDRGPEAVAA